MQFGLASFGDLNPLDEHAPMLDTAARLRQIVEEIRVADEVSIELFGTRVIPEVRSALAKASEPIAPPV